MKELSNIGKTSKEGLILRILRAILSLVKNLYSKPSYEIPLKTKKPTKEKNAIKIAQTIFDDLKRTNFSPHEFFVSDTARRLGIDNYTTDLSVLSNLHIVADKAQELRQALGYPVKITSAYRCLDLNKAVGSKDTSQHIKGQAIDFMCPKFGSPADIVRFIRRVGIKVDQCIVENGWVHLSIKSHENRNQFAQLIDGNFKIIA